MFVISIVVAVSFFAGFFIMVVFSAGESNRDAYRADIWGVPAAMILSLSVVAVAIFYGKIFPGWAVWFDHLIGHGWVCVSLLTVFVSFLITSVGAYVGIRATRASNYISACHDAFSDR